MTAYCTQADLETRFGAEEILELADRDADGVADDGVVDGVIDDVSATIDGYVSKRYDLPFATVPQALVRIACVLARYTLYINDPPDRITDAYKDAMAQLRDIGAGRMVLDVAGDEPTGAKDDVLVEGPDRLFSNSTMKSF